MSQYQAGESFPVDGSRSSSSQGKAKPVKGSLEDKNYYGYETTLPQRSSGNNVMAAGFMLLLMSAAGAGFVALRTYAQKAKKQQLRKDYRRAQAQARAQAQSSGPQSSPGRIGSYTLKGPNGVSIQFPPKEPTIINVFLQGCSDCMPAFEAYRDGPGFANRPVINVAYGSASLSWLEKYKMADNVVIDKGQAFVGPLGIRTFTSLVVDTNGSIKARAYPTQADYIERIEGALRALQDPGESCEIEPEDGRFQGREPRNNGGY